VRCRVANGAAPLAAGCGVPGDCAAAAATPAGSGRATGVGDAAAPSCACCEERESVRTLRVRGWAPVAVPVQQTSNCRRCCARTPVASKTKTHTNAHCLPVVSSRRRQRTTSTRHRCSVAVSTAHTYTRARVRDLGAHTRHLRRSHCECDIERHRFAIRTRRRRRSEIVLSQLQIARRAHLLRSPRHTRSRVRSDHARTG
jgi:hypothetical protein